MRPRRNVSLLVAMILSIALELAVVGFAPATSAYSVISFGQQSQLTWGRTPTNVLYAINPDLNFNLWVWNGPGQYSSNSLVNPFGEVQRAADTWNKASAFHFNYLPNGYNPANEQIVNVTAGNLSNPAANICNTNGNQTGVWCGTFNANSEVVGGRVVFNNNLAVHPVTYNTNGITWQTPDRRETDLFNLTLHEFGHVVLLQDNPAGHNESVMNWEATQKPNLANDDKQGASMLHGPYTGFEGDQAQGYGNVNDVNRAAYQQTVSGYGGAPIPEMFPIQGDYLGVQPIQGGWHQHIAGTSTSAHSYVYFSLFSYEDDSTPVPLAGRRYAKIPITNRSYLHWCQRNYQQATMSIDFEMDDGTTLRDSGISDDIGISVHPAQSGAYGTTSFCRDVPLNRLAGKRIRRWFIAYDSGVDNFDVIGQPFRAYFDDIKFLPDGKQGNQAIVVGAGSVTPGGPYGYNSLVSFSQSPVNNWLFTGWRVDGIQAGWASSLSATMDNRTVTTQFAPRPSYCDVPSNHQYYNAVSQLGARGIVKGYTNGCFGPGDIVQRAQATAFIARGMPSTNVFPGQTWDWEDWGNPFSDQNGLNANLWRNVGTLYHYGAASGYDAAGCAARGVAYPCFGPTDQVLEVQVIAYISRSMINSGRWTAVPSCSQYPNVTARQEVCTYYANAGAIAFTQSTGYQPATRGWFAQQWWQALNSYWSVDRTP